MNENCQCPRARCERHGNCADFQNPTGRTWGLERRQRLSELSAKYLERYDIDNHIEQIAEINARDVLERCIERKVAFVPGGSFFPNGGRENTLKMPLDKPMKRHIIELCSKH